LAGPTVVYVPFIIGKGTATLCALNRRHTTAAGQTITTTGTLAITLPQGKLTAAANEHQSPSGHNPNCSLRAKITTETGIYRDAPGVIVAEGSTIPTPDGLRCRELTFTFEFA
jgi:hypothetical protein